MNRYSFAARSTQGSTTIGRRLSHWGMAALLMSSLTLTACNDDNNTAASGGTGGTGGSTATPTATIARQGSANFVLAPVNQGDCTLRTTAGTIVAGPVKSINGVANFPTFNTSETLLQAVCTGGTYTDEATGANLTAPTLRNFVVVSANNFSVVVSPLTEIATRLLGTRDPLTNFSAVAASVASAFGLTGIDITKVIPTDLNTAAAPTGSAAGRYGIVLAALSQMQSFSAGATAQTIIDRLVASLNADGRFISDTEQNNLADAMERMTENPRLNNKFNESDLQVVYEALASTQLLATIDYVDTDFSLTQTGDASNKVAPNLPSSIAIIGKNLHEGLRVTLGGLSCLIRDIERLDDTEVQSDIEEMVAECPQFPVGNYTIVVKDGEQTLHTSTIVATAAANNDPKSTTLKAANVGGGTAIVTGVVKATTPRTFYPNNNNIPEGKGQGGLDYANTDDVPVAGVLVDLVRVSDGAVLATDVTGQDNGAVAPAVNTAGTYTFNNAPNNLSVKVVVRAQIKSPAGGQHTYDLAVRDNTSNTGTNPKTLYTLSSDAFTTAEAAAANQTSTVNLTAKMGFNANGTVKAGEARESAPFAILAVINSAVEKLKSIPNTPLVLPTVNIYWSINNTTTGGDKEQGQINTSHYANGGTLPGVFILGKADVDTDEFDKGVNGHEFGHYLQSVLSYSDNPGGSHAGDEFQDPSLAYGEGYGTALGGLLALPISFDGSANKAADELASNGNYYCDSTGANQAQGGCQNLNTPQPADKVNGFYQEHSISYLMYQIGKTDGVANANIVATSGGFVGFWRAVSNMRTMKDSAHIFSFLDEYCQVRGNAANAPNALNACSNGGYAVPNQFLTDANIRTTARQGGVAVGNPDPALAEANTKGQASQGAADLETLYLTFNVPAANAFPAAPAEGQPAVAVSTSPSFCFNTNLKGDASRANKLGLFRRINLTLPAGTSGKFNFRLLDAQDNAQKPDGYSIGIKKQGDDGRTKVFTRSSDGASYSDLASGDYVVRVNIDDPSTVYEGNRCGNKLQLMRISD